MPNLLIISGDICLVQNLLKDISNHQDTNISTTVSKFLRKTKQGIIAIPINESLNTLPSQTLNEINKLIKYNSALEKKNRIIEELKNIGYNFKYKGTHYLIDTILEVHKNDNIILESLQGNFYPLVAKKHKKTVQDIKNCIKIATNSMYYENSADKIKEYFSLCDDVKPSVKQVIFTVANKIYS